MPTRSTALLLGIGALLNGCQSSHRLPEAIDNRARTVVETARYEVRHRGEIVGSVPHQGKRSAAIA